MTQGKLLKKSFEERGITLIALIITIVVLLILAVVAIQAVTGDGIISKAIKARQASELAEKREKVMLAISQAKINPKYNYKLTSESLSEAIDKYFGEDATVEGGPEAGYYVITIEGKNTYKIDLNGNIIEQLGDTEGDTEEEPEEDPEDIYAGAPSSITISGYTNVAQGSTIRLYAYGNDGSMLFENEVEWISDNTEIVTIQELSGWVNVTGVSAGTVKIIARSTINPNIYGETTITVNAAGQTSISISGPTTAKVGETIYLYAEDQNGNSLSREDVTWSIGEGVTGVTLDIREAQTELTSYTAGTIPIIATLKENPTVSDTIYVYFTREEPTSIKISGPTTAKVGEPIFLSAEDQNGKLLSAEDVIWSSSYSGVTVDNWGRIMASMAGSTQVRVTSKTNPSVYAEVYIIISPADPPIDTSSLKITAEGTKTSVKVGENITLWAISENRYYIYEPDVVWSVPSWATGVTIYNAGSFVLIKSTEPGSIPVTVTSTANPSISDTMYVYFSL